MTNTKVDTLNMHGSAISEQYSNATTVVCFTNFMRKLTIA